MTFKPLTITLCGSARFETWFHVWNRVLTCAGHTVFSLACFPSIMGSRTWYTDFEKQELDRAHLRKIDASDAILVLNVAAYIGESTMREIQHANNQAKRVVFLESWGSGCGVDGHFDDATNAIAERYGVHGTRSPIDATARPGYPYDLLGPAGGRRSRLVEVVNAHKDAERRAARKHVAAHAPVVVEAADALTTNGILAVPGPGKGHETGRLVIGSGGLVILFGKRRRAVLAGRWPDGATKHDVGAVLESLGWDAR